MVPLQTHTRPPARQVESLTRALAARRPNSLPAAVAAAKPAPQEAALVRQLTSEVGALQARLAREARAHERGLRALEQQYEALKHSLAKEVRRGNAGGGL